jgi:hypothetical protein
MGRQAASGERGFSRRTMLQGLLAAGAVAAMPSACAQNPSTPAPPMSAPPTSAAPGGALTVNGLGRTPADYARVGLQPDAIQVWEDGFRTAPVNSDPKVFEWWYSDFTGEDGTVVSFTLNTRLDDGFLPSPGEDRRLPFASVIVTDPDGTNHAALPQYRWADFTSATDRCDVRLGPFTFTGDLKTYRMTGEANGVGVDLTLTNTVAPFRAGTGYIFFGDTDQYHAWLATVPRGRAEGTVTVNGQQRPFTGQGYHDHNWGTIPYPRFMEHWRWGRGSAGPNDKYAVIAAVLHLRPEWGSTTSPVLLVDDVETGKRLIASSTESSITATESNPRPHPNPTYPTSYLSTVIWGYTNAADSATITFTDTDKLITTRRYLSNPTPEQQTELDQLGIDQIWYTRFDAGTTVDLTVAGTHDGANGKGTLENGQFGLRSSP